MSHAGPLNPRNVDASSLPVSKMADAERMRDIGWTMPTPDEHPESVAAIAYRLRMLRLALGHENQNAFAAFVGMAPTSWNNYEKGERRISLDEARKLLRVLGISLDWIYQGIEASLPSDLVRRMRELERAASRKRA